jgi:hypothetical protein
LDEIFADILKHFSAKFQALNGRLHKDVESLSSRLNKMQVDFKLKTETLETLMNENSTKTCELKVILYNKTYMFLV